jgi:mono/diheme cytochrome c family protein
MRWIWLALLGIASLAKFAIAEEPIDFARQVAPIFERRCVSCHNQTERKGGLSVETSAAALAGGESGAMIEPGQPENSFLLDYITGDKPEMPKSGPPLTAQEIATIRAWIAAGAKWPASVVLRHKALADKNWWSLAPLKRPKVPQVVDAKATIRNPIDAFIVARLQSQGLAQSPAADRRTLVRRLYFDLIGLPPSWDEMQTLVADDSPQAYERLVDRLLESPAYGERWARHWLDVVHFGETHGYDKDKPRPHAWPYRDYVIRALNRDKPYSQFVAEQIAGDVLYPGTADGVEALGLIAAGPWDFIGHAEVPETKIDGKIARHLDRDDMVANTVGTFCSLTVSCAQCHNHKFDPITQEDYYSLQAVFAAIDRADKAYDRDPAVAAQRAALQQQLTEAREQQKHVDEQISQRGGAELAALEARIAEIAARPKAGTRPEFGYHSAISAVQNVTKWVQLDLGSSQAIGEIVVVGCHDDFNNIGAGFGFPLRYKIEASDDPAFAADVKLVLDRTASDVANPGIAPQRISTGEAKARYLRFTATKLAPRKNDYIFALAEMQVFAPGGQNIAAGAPVAAFDTIEAPPRWSRKNLVDGVYFASGAAYADELDKLAVERKALLDRVVGGDLQRQRATTAARQQAISQQLGKLPPPSLVYAAGVYRGKGAFAGTGAVGGKPRDIFVLARGDVRSPGKPALPGTVDIIPGVPCRFELPPEATEGERRAALARWITRTDNPLTWRSIVNRVWQHHFGRAIVDTPNDFGRMGELPSHAELLDWLAVEFRDNGQSLKRLHKLIVCSATYRQASSGPKDAASAARAKSLDADNRLLWRANRRRLEAEAVHDAVLRAAGKLNLQMGGPSFQDFVIEQPAHSPHYEYRLHDPADPRSHRRSIYRFIVRSQPQPFVTTLDCADPSMRVDKRNESISALQALALLNNGLMVTMSKHFAERVARVSPVPQRQVAALFHIALARSPTAEEQAALAQYIREHGLTNACRLVLNLNEFTFVD